MRADRLISIIMLLERQGKLTARQLAVELEVSERTIYRDITALSTAGVPIYTEDGPGGGISLVEDYKTDLTGLTADEVRALAMVNIPEPLIKLGVGQELKSALLKISASLPAVSRDAETRTRQRIHLDASWWFEPETPAPHLQTIQQALFQQRKLQLTWQDFMTDAEGTFDPYGLAAKSNTWYLVAGAGDHIRVLRVSRVIAARVLDQTFEYPESFSLPEFWKEWCEDFKTKRDVFSMTARLSPELIQRLTRRSGEGVNPIPLLAGVPDENGWIIQTLPFESFEAARAWVLSYGSAIEVLEPYALRASVIDFACQTLSRYPAEALPVQERQAEQMK